MNRLQNRTLCIWLRHWPLQRLRAAQPELKSAPLALYEPDPRGGLQITGCCPQAARRGITPGITLAEARSLAVVLKNGAGAVSFLPGEPAADRAALESVAAWCEEFSPCVALEEFERPESLLLDITGLEPLFGSEAMLAELVARAFAAKNLVAHIAVADTPGAAWAISHESAEAICAARTNFVPPFQVVTAGETLAAISSLSVAALRLPDAVLDRLAELGVECIEQLIHLPREGLAVRFGPLLAWRLDQALGAAPEPLTAHRPPPEIVVQSIWEYATGRAEMIDFALADLTPRVAWQLAERQQGAIELACRLVCQPGGAVECTVKLFQPSACAEHLLELLRMRMERTRLPGPVCEVQLAVLRSARLECRQQLLFDEDASHDAPRHLAALVDRLSSRLRSESVLRPRAIADPQPEYAFRYEPLAGAARKAAQGKPGKKSRRQTTTLRGAAKRLTVAAAAPQESPLGPVIRPLWMETTPQKIEVLAVAPAGPPRRFRWQGCEQTIVQHWGPERIETGWWRGRSIRRDYYRVEVSSGSRYWLFRNLRDGGWFLHGTFA